MSRLAAEEMEEDRRDEERTDARPGKNPFQAQAEALFRSLHLQDNWTIEIAAALEKSYARGYDTGHQAALLEVCRSGM
jgi:hypothetical protein